MASAAMTNCESRETDGKNSQVWDCDIIPSPGDALRLSLLPDEFLQGDLGELRIKRTMLKVDRCKVAHVDGLDYQPDHTRTLDRSLVMIAAANNAITVLQDWTRRFGVNIFNHRNDIMWSPLVYAICNSAENVKEFILSLVGVEIGIPEAAALGRKELTRKLVADYNAKQEPERWPHFKRGEEIAYLFSALTGMKDWVSEWMDQVDDINIGSDFNLSVLSYATLSGSPSLVRHLIESGAEKHNIHSRQPLIFYALSNVDMVQFLVEEIDISIIDQSDYHLTTLDAALLGGCGCAQTCRYLLENVPASEWANISKYHPVVHAIYRWLPPDITYALADTLKKGDLQVALRYAVREGNYQVVNFLVQKGADLSHTPPPEMLNLFEEAVQSGSLKTVKYVLEKAPKLVEYKHNNGFNCLVAAVRSGSNDIFQYVASHVPQNLNFKFWQGSNIWMETAGLGAVEIFDSILGDNEFYDSVCRGKHMDANTRKENGDTLLRSAIQSPYMINVDMVDKLLSRKDYLNLEECTKQSAVNEMYLLASQQHSFEGLLASFSHHGLFMKSKPSASLTVSAAESGSLFRCEPQAILNLRRMDESVGFSVTDEALLCAMIINAPESILREGRVSLLIESMFAGKECMKSRTVLEHVVGRCDLSLARLFSKQLEAVLSDDPIGWLTMSLKKFNKNKTTVTPFISRRLREFTLWCMGMMGEEVSVNGRAAYDLLNEISVAELDVTLVQRILASPLEMPKESITSLLFQVVKSCQLENLKSLVALIGDNSVLSAKEKGETKNLLTAALTSSLKCFRDAVDPRLPLVQWLHEKGEFDLNWADKDGETLLMHAAESGRWRLFEWICQNVDSKSLEAKTKIGESLLKFACKGGHQRIARLVFAAAPSPGALGPGGETIAHYAAMFDQFGIMRFAVESAQIDINVLDLTGRSALEYAALVRCTSDMREYLDVLSSSSLTDEENSLSVVQGWICTLGRKLGKNLSLNASGICAFTYDDLTFVIEAPQSVKSLFIYCTIDQKYVITDDSLLLLLNLANPDFGYHCPSIDPTSSWDTPEVLVSESRRVDEMDIASFENFLENFIDKTLEVKERMGVCFAERQLESVLEQVEEANGNSTQKSFQKISNELGSFLIKATQPESFSAEDVSVFRAKMAPFFERISSQVGKRIDINEQGIAGFQYKDLTFVTSPASASEFRLSCDLYSTYSQLNPRTIQQALRLNYLQQETRGAVLFARQEKIIELQILGITETKICIAYQDSLDNITVVHFRNILENFIDTAVTLKMRLSSLPESPSHEPHPNPFLSWDKNKTGTLMRIQSNPSKAAEELLDVPKAKLTDILKGVLGLVATSENIFGTTDVWPRFLSPLIEKASKHDDSDIKQSCVQTIVDLTVKNLKLQPDLLAELEKQHPGVLVSKGLSQVFMSEELVKAGKTASTARLLVEVASQSNVSQSRDSVSNARKEWDKYSVNLIQMTHLAKDVGTILDGLDFIFADNQDVDTEKDELRHLIYAAASVGSPRIIQYLLDRFGSLSVDEETLIWACKASSNQAELATFLLSNNPRLPRGRALTAAAASHEGKEVLRALGIGQGTTRSDSIEGRFFLDAGKAALAGGNWDCLRQLVSDERIREHIRGLLEYACMGTCPDTERAIQVLISSQAARSIIHSLTVPWQAEAKVLREASLPLLLLAARKGLFTQDILSIVWSFCRPMTDQSPIVRSPDRLWDELRVPLQRDLGVGSITRVERTFYIPGIGELCFSNSGMLYVQKQLEKTRCGIKASTLLRVSSHLGGSHIASTHGIFLRHVIGSGDELVPYSRLLARLNEFSRATNVMRRVLDKIQEKKLSPDEVNTTSMIFTAPKVQEFLEVEMESNFLHHERKFFVTTFKNSSSVRVWTKVLTEASESAGEDVFAHMLEENLLQHEQTYFCCLSGNEPVVCAYVKPPGIDNFAAVSAQLVVRAKEVEAYIKSTLSS